MITFCNNPKCLVPWLRLWADEDPYSDEVYEYCPVCKSNIHLEEKPEMADSEGMIMSLSGYIFNPLTKEPFGKTITPAPPVRRRKIWDEKYEEFIDRRTKAHDAALEVYFENCKTMSHEEARRLFKWPVIKRKFHFEKL